MRNRLFGLFCFGAMLVSGLTSASAATKPANSVAKPVAKPIEVLLLTALPGSGKSEVRRYLATLSQKECREKFGIGKTVAIDDFPFVHIMRRISDELTARGEEGAYFLSPVLPFRDPRHWGTLVNLVNEDYQDMVAQKKAQPRYAAKWIFDRLDAAYVKAGGMPILSKLKSKVRYQVLKALESDAQKLLKSKNTEIDKAKDLEGKTIVVEFSRGGADLAPMPLPAPYGYKYSLAQLSSEILKKASILYLEVSPEESRRKNEARANPNDPGSILSHMVPRAVMYTEYGSDDMAYLEKKSDKPNTIRVEAYGNVYHLPLGRFDNKVDKTTFAHADVSAWKKTDVTNLRTALNKAFAPLTA